MMGVLKILGMLTLFGLDWLYEKMMTVIGIVFLVLICIALIVIFKE